MVQLAALIGLMAIFFAYLGFQRGWSKELIATSGVVLGLFTLHQFDTIIRDTLLAGFQSVEKFYIQTLLFLVIVFFAYQTRALIGSDARAARGGDGRDSLQSSTLGAIVGAFNGYLIGGSVWYFLHINRDPVTNIYPLDPNVVTPTVGSVSAEFLPNLPLFVLAQGPGSTGDLLSLAVIVLFLVVLILI